MYIAGYFANDGQSRPTFQGGIYEFRYNTVAEAQSKFDTWAKTRPSVSFTGVVIDEETMQIVKWVKYAPAPLLNWQTGKF
jgi:hypothetical protein